ncbi:MAG: M1 family aminopeptidase [Sandaracinaceae bacterium]
MSHRFACALRARGADAGRPRSFALPGDQPDFFRARAFVLEELRLDLELRWSTHEVAGKASLVLRRLDPDARWAVLDAVEFADLTVTRLRDGGREPAAFRYDGERLEVDLSDVGDGGRADVEVAYRCQPRRGLYFVGPDEARPDRPRQVWTQCQDTDGRHFFPCQDHPGQRMRTEVAVTVPEGMVALSNGALVEERPAPEGTRFVWRQEQAHPAYLVTVVVGEFDVAEDEVDGLPLTYYVPKGRGEAIERSLGRTPEMVRLFAERLQTPFPWSKYAQVVVSDFIFGGMENTSATTLFERALLDERAALDAEMDTLVAHELAHQWFGDLVTCRHWSHAWLNEGFATFFEHVWIEHADGEDDYLYSLERDLDVYLAEHRTRYARPVVTRSFSAPIDVFDRHLYQKGGLIVHALRRTLGDGPFWRGLAAYLERFRGRGVETRDLLHSLEDSTGRALEGFFATWIERAGHPVLEVSAEPRDGVVRVTVTQAHPGADDDLFEVTLPVVLATEAGAVEHRLRVRREQETFSLPCPEEPRYLAVDPALTVPGVQRLKLPRRWLTALLADARPARARWLAARALADVREPKALEALQRALTEDPFWGVRAEAAKAIGEHGTSAAFEALAFGEGDASPRTRRAVAKAYGAFRTGPAAARLMAWIERGDASYLVEAELRRSLGRTRRAEARAILEARLAQDGPSWGEVLRSGAVDGLAALRDPAAVETLLALLRTPTTDDLLRRSVLSALADVRETTEDRPTLRAVREEAERQLDRFDPNVRAAAVRLLAAVADRRDLPVLRRVAEHDLDGRVRRVAGEAVRDVTAEQRQLPRIAALEEQLEKLRRELGELRAEVGQETPKT